MMNWKTIHLDNHQHDQLLDAIIYNADNLGAHDTDSLLINMLRSTNTSAYPTHDARNRFY